MRVTETYTAVAAGTLVGLVQWALSIYAFGGHEPPAVTAAVFLFLPGALAGVSAFFTRRTAKHPEPVSATPEPAGPAAATAAD